MNNIIGTCSECGGPVKMPSMMVNPVPCCERCGAIAANPFGPVIQMKPSNKINYGCTCGGTAICPLHGRCYDR